MQGLKLLPHYFEKAKRGEKRGTIRVGRKPFIVGPAELVRADTGERFGVHITRVELLTFNLLRHEDIWRDGFQSRKVLWAALKNIYPELQPDDDLTVVTYLPTTELPEK